MKAIAESTGREMKKIKESYAEIGDLGVVAMVSGRNCCSYQMECKHEKKDSDMTEITITL